MGRKIKPRPPVRPTMFLLVVIVVGLLTLFGLAKLGKINVNKAFTEEKKDVAQEIVCVSTDLLTGVCHDSEKLARPVVGVMLDNAPEARPQSGLAAVYPANGGASLVFEAIAEFPYTRFLAFYSSPESMPDKIGPVRSARKYFVEWAKEFDAAYVHCGGSPEGLDVLKELDVKDLNEFYNSKYFYRSWTQAAPHNVYTSKKTIISAVSDKDWDDVGAIASWNFKDDVVFDARPLSQEIKIDFGSSAFVVDWKYDQRENVYARQQGGVDVKISSKNVAVMYVDSKVVDNVGRRQMQTVGAGKAVVFRDGMATVGEWRRPDILSRTRFYDEAGVEIFFNRGATWIEVVPSDMPDAVFYVAS